MVSTLKGYIFELENGIEMVVGSSNITRYALLKNIEWDLVVNCEHDTEAYLDAMNEFESLWNQTYELSQEGIKELSTKLSFAIEHWDMDYDMADFEIKPNYMQRKALRELNRYRAIGQETGSRDFCNWLSEKHICKHSMCSISTPRDCSRSYTRALS